MQTLSGPEETYFYERIEFLKGPSSILYGQTSPGGIINLISKRPTIEQTAEVGLQVGSWNRRQIKADIGGPVAEGSEWGYRVTGLIRDSETMIEQIPDDRRSFSGALSWTPSEKTSLNIQATHQNNETIFVAGLPADGTIFSNPNGKIARDFFQGEPGVDYFDISRQTLSYQLEHQFNDTWSFRQNVLRYDTETEYKLLGAFRTAVNSERREFDRFAQWRIEKEDGISIDNQLQAKWGSGNVEHTALIGVDYSDGNFSQQASYGAAEPIDFFNPAYGLPVTFPEFTPSTVDGKQLGIYAQDQIKIAGSWVALLGGRWDESETINENTSDFTFRAGLVYLFDNGLAPYLSYSQSFQPNSGLGADGKPFDPTTGEQLEVGLKYEPSTYNATYTASVYEIVQQNVLTQNPNGIGPQVAQGEVESSGFEFEARAELNEHFGLITTYAYNHNEVTKDNVPTKIGDKQVSQPRKTAAIWLDYHVLGGFLPGLTISGGARYVNGLLNSGNTVEVPSYSVMDMALQYEGKENWKVQLNVNNLFDKEYVSACGYNCYYGDERNLMLSAAYTW
ncbi:MAG: TonB-dependent siderophore receptor [Cellvibrionaceae bacterium]|nr:TonB-dependent siderophore receptor [Cellvibrionaceae bacterium]